MDEAIRVLVVEDHADSRDMYAEYLRFSGFEVETASDGVAALEKARSFDPAVIVLDIGLPELDGFSVLAEIRNDPWLCEIPVVTVSAAVGAGYAKRAARGGATKVLRKPCTPDDLANAIRSAQASAPAE
jgi:CheY-like chemotaxis protein